MIANGSPLASVVAGSCSRSSLSSFVCDSRCLAAAATSILRPRIQPVGGGASTCATKRNYVAIPKIPAAAHFLDSVAHFSETMAGKTPSCSSSSMNKKGSSVLQACGAGLNGVGKLRDWGRSSATRCIAGRISFCGDHTGRGTQTPSSQNSKRWQATMNCTTVLDSEDSLCEDGRHQATPSTSQHHATWSSFSRQGVHYKFPAAPQGPSLHPSISTTDVRRGCARTSRFTSSVPRARAGARRAPHPHHAHQVRYLTHYQRLGIEPPSNPGEIKRAYFAKAKECHPDIHGDAKTKEFQELSAAYAVLSDERKKASYDASGYQDRNYDAPSDPNRHHRSDIPDLDAAFAMFRQVFSEYGFQMYYDTLQQDVQNTYEKAVETQSYEPFYDLANRRKGLVFGIVVPALLLFRFPWLALAATRMLGSVGMFLFQVIARNPRLQAAVAAWLWKRIVEFSARMSRDGEKSSSTSEDARKTPGGRKTKR